jgi:hypothetical protein
MGFRYESGTTHLAITTFTVRLSLHELVIARAVTTTCLQFKNWSERIISNIPNLSKNSSLAFDHTATTMRWRTPRAPFTDNARAGIADLFALSKSQKGHSSSRTFKFLCSACWHESAQDPPRITSLVELTKWWPHRASRGKAGFVHLDTLQLHWLQYWRVSESFPHCFAPHVGASDTHTIKSNYAKSRTQATRHRWCNEFEFGCRLHTALRLSKKSMQTTYNRTCCKKMGLSDVSQGIAHHL